ncbi:orexin receptor type 2-like [Rhopalosiphum padi]|uniref:orexin receptor type 2-like n=1 Tax=Rhopalosiphum padi TaxID=40932 RepID=UPI00298E32CE|nr:orexin receptor type 2-like [Rhopalosiphum padi]
MDIRSTRLLTLGSNKMWLKWTLITMIAFSTTGVAEGHVNMTIRKESTMPPSTAENVTEYDEMANYTDEEYANYIENYVTPQKSEWVFIVMHSMVFVVGLIGNALVCVAVYRNRTMRTVTNYFIVNLAVADFLVILICLPPTVVWDVTETWFMGTLACKMVLYFQTVSVTVSVMTLTSISIDRWYAICHPLKFKSTTSRARTAIIIIWIVGLASDIPELLVLEAVGKTKRFSSIYLTQCEALWSQESETTYQVAKTIMLYILPLLLMSIAYYQIVRVLWKSDNIPGHTETVQMFNANAYNGFNRTATMGCTSTMAQIKARRKAAKMLVAVVVMFALCFFLVHLMNLLRFTVGIQQSQTTALVSNLSHWLCYANSAVNPLIYNFMSGKYRNEFKRLFLCWGSHRQNRLRRGAHTSRSGTYICRFTMTTMKTDNVSFGLSPEDIQ